MKRKELWPAPEAPPTFDLPETIKDVAAIHELLVGLPFVTGVTQADQRIYITLSRKLPLSVAKEIVRRLVAL